MIRRPTISISFVTLAASLWFLLLYNGPFWSTLFRIAGEHVGRGAAVIASLFVAFALLFNMVLCIVCFRFTTKPVLIFLFMTASAAAYFMNQYGVMLDRGMIHNVFATDPKEVRDLLTPKLLLYVLFLGVLPSALTGWIRIDYRGLWRGLLIRAGWLAASALLVGAIVLVFYQDYASIFRNHREIRFLLTPSNYLNAMYGLARDSLARPKEIRVIGEDARRSESWPAGGKKTVLIIVVGETARAANFSLGGYVRMTNPMLARQDIIYYTNTLSCGTDTASSVPCMFSDLGSAGYSDDRASRQEDLLDVLKRAGIAVLWRDNNSGCKGVCDRVDYQDIAALRTPSVCRSDECYDEILLEKLQDYLDGLDRDAVIVLHQKGSHGPAYYLRYPDKFSVFAPVCQTSQLEKCSREEIVNAYDNTILYTDFFLDRVITLLKNNSKRLDTSMIYMSDHGESLGENNLYLHGLPRMLAPKEQLHVPFVVWLSEGVLQSQHLDRACLEARRRDAYSHDNLFHSVLGLMGVNTRIYRSGLDVFHACKAVPEAVKN